MLTGSAITRALVIVVLAAGLAGLWQLLIPRATGPHISEPPKRAEAGRSAPPLPAPTSESGDPVRSVYPGPRPADTPQRPPVVAEAPPVASPAPVPAPAPIPTPIPAPAPSPPPVFTPSVPLPQVDTTADTEPSTGTVDLNTASLAELNGLGGGLIGKAIIAKRPYASPGELLSKRVLSRATYEKIKDQVTVR
ncbi:helix-hairpin-helix domain-containing protein [Methylobacterium aquaticum]|uniref:helix-hairpin-helix domain-containing protein n=1 Tax=Methylobacterium aquaticum TaxID=270351 RepID=UPI003D16C28C